MLDLQWHKAVLNLYQKDTDKKRVLVCDLGPVGRKVQNHTPAHVNQKYRVWLLVCHTEELANVSKLKLNQNLTKIKAKT